MGLFSYVKEKGENMEDKKKYSRVAWYINRRLEKMITDTLFTQIQHIDMKHQRYGYIRRNSKEKPGLQRNLYRKFLRNWFTQPFLVEFLFSFSFFLFH